MHDATSITSINVRGPVGQQIRYYPLFFRVTMFESLLAKHILNRFH